MMELLQKSEYEQVYAIMHDSFPADERRSYIKQKALLDEKSYCIYKYKNDVTNEIEAFISAWDFDQFAYIEHFAVAKQFRNNGLGKRMIQELLANLQKPVFLEVELPETQVAQKRIQFYERQGFVLNVFEITQPPLAQGENPVQLKIMSYPNVISAKEFHHYKKMIFQVVYKTTETF